MKYIGLDPGTHTGVAVWDTDKGEFSTLETLPLWKAMLLIRDLYLTDSVEVIFEDARLRRWFGNAGREQLQGAGSIKRDCSIWEEFLLGSGIPFRAMPPTAGQTKWSAEYFRKVTGWKGRTSEHARDAAILVFGRH